MGKIGDGSIPVGCRRLSLYGRDKGSLYGKTGDLFILGHTWAYLAQAAMDLRYPRKLYASRGCSVASEDEDKV